jgi:hypothetical protein
MKGFLYVASPYSRYPDGLDAAFEAACKATGALIARGIPAFSPIAHSHPVARVCGIDPLDHAIWLPDAPLMDAAAALLVVKLDGWADSLGVAHEIKAFIAAGKPVIYATAEEVCAPYFLLLLGARMERAA